MYVQFTNLMFFFSYRYFEEISNREQMKWIKSWQGICGFISTVFADGILFLFSGIHIHTVLLVPILKIKNYVCIQYDFFYFQVT